MRSFFTSLLFFLFSFFNGSAQVCNGYLGQVHRITFGSGNSYTGPALASGITTYNYVNNGCPEDGEYSLIKASDGCKRDWHVLNSDHTGNNNGYMLLFNSSFSPGTFYTHTIRNQLCSNITYEFSVWMMNMLKPDGCSGNGTKPNVTFSIETPAGLRLGTYTTGAIEPTAKPEWKEYTILFKLPQGVTDVVVKMINNAPGGCGNDLLIDDITFKACGPLVRTKVGNSTRSTVYLCEGERGNFNIYMQDVIVDYQNPGLQWQFKNSNNDLDWVDMPGQNTADIDIEINGELGIYQYRLAVWDSNNSGSANCRVYSNPVTIDVSAYPVPVVSSNNPACAGQPLRLRAAGGATYRWTGPNGFTSTQQNPVINNITMAAAGEYKVTVTSAKGCSTDASLFVTVNPSPTASVGPGATICEGSSVQLTSSGGGTYSWSPSTGLSDTTIANPIASPTDTTVYRVTVTNEFGCTDTKSVRINVLKAPIADAGSDLSIKNGESVQLEGRAFGTNVSYSWSPSTYLDNPNALNPSARPTADITYTLTVISEDGCGISTDEVFVRVYNEISVPNSFSPNGDGINDLWKIQSIDTYPKAKIFIYNRHGQLLFQSIEGANTWDGRHNGKPVPIGTYYYIIQLEADLPKRSGWITVVH
jgi:gliding motility-associated-like protein